MSSRRLVCFVSSVTLTICGLCLILFTAVQILLENGYTDYYDTKLLLAGALYSIAGILGSVAHNPRKSYGIVKASVIPYIVVCVVIVLTSNPIGSGNLQHSHFNQNYIRRSNGQLTVVVFKVITANCGQLLAAIGIAFSCLDLQVGCSKPSSKRASVVEKPGGKQYIQLPEARTHVQEAPGTGEKITVITLPQAEKMVYAVPEDNYVIRRDGTYVAPPGNANLAVYFPSYTKVQID